MKANDFIKKFGLAKARKLVQGYPNTTTYKFYDYYFDSSSGEYVSVGLSQLKRLVESHELVEKVGGLAEAKRIANNPLAIFNTLPLKQAIVDVESCL